MLLRFTKPELILRTFVCALGHLICRFVKDEIPMNKRKAVNDAFGHLRVNR